ncbi:Endogenous retrovirus group K member 6 Pol protein, partial [Eudyptes sclateri]
GSPQLVEIYTVIQVFHQWEMPLNLVTDSQYVANVVRRLEKAWLKEVDSELAFLMFKQLWDLLSRCVNPYYVLHVRSHTSFPGFISEGNAQADRLTAPAWTVSVPDVSTQARLLYEFFHQSARMLRRQFGLTWDTAQSIIQMCPDSQCLAPIPQRGVNPRGEKALQIWQSDVTHIGEFGKQKYVHVSIDTFSGALWATAETREKSKDILRHWKGAFAALGVPHQIKTDNGPGAKTQAFLAQWGIRHITSIPYSPQSQGIVERAYLALKQLLQKQ